jgi:hypothetical protein
MTEPAERRSEIVPAEDVTQRYALEERGMTLEAGVLDVHFTSPVPVYGLLGARASSPLLKQAGRLRSQGTGSEFTKQTSREIFWFSGACSDLYRRYYRLASHVGMCCVALCAYKHTIC